MPYFIRYDLKPVFGTIKLVEPQTSMQLELFLQAEESPTAGH